MKTVLCDASPLIFLAKLDRLELIPQLLGGEVCVVRLVVDEVCRADALPVELGRLRRFVAEIEVIDFEDPGPASHSLSRSDRSTLAWAMRNRPVWLLADERLVRRIAVDDGLRVIGTLGLLFRARHTGRMSREETLRSINDLVSLHAFRISVELYCRILAELAAG